MAVWKTGRGSGESMKGQGRIWSDNSQSGDINQV